MYDTIIIGAGPAGITAAIYAARREMKTLIIAKEVGGQMVIASDIENYPGFNKINNYDLILKFQEQVKNLGVEIKNTEIKKVEKEGDKFILFSENEKFEAKTVITTVGLMPRRLYIKGEEEFIGKGVSYCANCDGPFFKGKTVVVVGGGNAALDAAEVLSKMANKVYLIHRRDEFRGFEVLVEKVKKQENIEILLNSEIKEIKGEEKVKNIVVINKELSKKTEIAVDGVFVEVGRVASVNLVNGLVELNEKNEIVVDEKCASKTEGLFVAGDVTQVPFKQITIASGQGTIAALAAYQYLQLKDGKNVNIVFDRSKK